MTTKSIADQLVFLEKAIGPWVLGANEEFKGSKVLKCAVHSSDQLDGFMSRIYTAELDLQLENGSLKTLNLVVKVMKGSRDFRESSKSFVQFQNEVYIYGQVIPAFRSFLEGHPCPPIDMDKWIPRVYYQYYGECPGLSDMDESILVMENISINGGFRSGPRLELDLNHFQVMMKTIAEYHCLTYAMRISKDPKLEELKSGIIPLPWKEPNNLYSVLYKIAFERLFDYIDRNPHLVEDAEKEDIENLRSKFYEKPSDLLEMFREDDQLFSVINHGDYNRNNVLYRYKENSNIPEELRMIDFQEVRYGSPCLDLFFYMYMSSTPELRENHWDDLLKLYHSTIIKNLKIILNCDENDPRLSDYSYEKFEDHFARFAFYGTMVTIHFLPWMDSPEHECEAVSAEFERDMRSPKFHELSMAVGGDSSNEKIWKCVQHASKMGYMKFIAHV